MCYIVDGEGVVGAQPTIRPGKSFEYTSSARLWSRSGMMRGHYILEPMPDQLNVAETICATIPAFSLDCGEQLPS